MFQIDNVFLIVLLVLAGACYAAGADLWKKIKRLAGYLIHR